MTAGQLSFRTCGLCGEASFEVETRLVEYTDEARRSHRLPLYARVDRCVDRAACRGRVELVLGEPWPVNDRTPAPAPNPLPALPPTVPDAEEEIAWLSE